MSDLIDRQAFIENERKLYCEDCDRRKGTKNGKPNVICYEIGEAPCRACWLDDALGDLEDFPTASPWRRVGDELPDKYTQCLVADADGKCAVGYYRYDCEAWDSPAFGWIESEDRIYIDDMPMGIGKVVAWMPIEPPKEEN